jgi:AraC-like DNA-binding protein
MNILACVPAELLTRLRAVCHGAHRVHAALDWEDVAGAVERHPVDVIVVDPRFGSPATLTLAPVLELRRIYPSTPFVIYTTLDAKTLPAIVTLGRSGINQLIIVDVDDEPEQLCAIFERQPGARLSDGLADALAPQLSQLPPDVAAALERVIHTPSAFDSVPDLAAAAKVSRRTIYRECERAALASPREIIAAARALRAYALLREGDMAIEDVAEALGFSSPHHLAKTMRWASGMTTARARARIAPDEFVQMLVARVAPMTSSSSAS